MVFFSVRAHGLAGLAGVAFDVEEVIDDLEREAEILRERLQRRERFGGGTGGDRARRRRGTEQRAGLAAMDALEHLELICCSVASRSAAWPPINPSQPTASDISSVSCDACGGSYDRDHHSKRLVEQTERRKDGDRFAKGHVIRRPAASQRRIVHGRGDRRG